MKDSQAMSIDPSPAAFEATERDFEQTVIQKSFEVPVVVDFWAPWCAPCKELGPTLERMAADSKGRFVLAKVNVDENQHLADALQIRSIPVVKLIVQGQIKDEFVGALPEPAIKKFLDLNLPTEQDLEAEQGAGLLKSGDTAAAERVFRETLQSDAKNAKALVGLGLILIDQGKLDEAKERLGQIDEEDDIRRELAQLRAKVFLHEHAGDEMALRAQLQSDPMNLEAKFGLACRDAVAGRHGPALEAFLEIVKTDRKFRDDGGRKGMVSVFDVLPPKSPLEPEYRNKLSSILFV